MLAGIKKGKRKRKTGDDSSSQSSSKVKKSENTANDNHNAADELRRMLSSGSKPIPVKRDAMDQQHVSGPSVLERFEQRRGILANAFDEKEKASSSLIMMNSETTGTLRKEDFKSGARKGKLKEKNDYFHSDADKTVAELVAEEKQSQQQEHQSMDEVFARNISRLGSRYKGNEFKVVAGASAGADEDDMAGDGGIDMKMFTSNENRLTEAARFNREKSRQVAKAKKEEKITSRCWWWMESSNFQKHRLISLGDYVSLVLVPSHNALVESQCYLVPVQHAESFASCEDEVWEEVHRFRTSLRKMFAKEGKSVLFAETVLPTKGLWQARMDCIPVPTIVEQDAQIFFKSAMTEQAEEWGTHNKILSTTGKGLRRTIPKGFSYFNIEWDDGGFAQIIESNKFPKDFGLDTIAGMMELDPMRFNRKQKSADFDRGAVLDFLKRWKEVDWTVHLDGNEA
ncbi:hypothetical protein CTEN210_10731 [Chaetoceros tenuissimus]|uniref:Cwf19-like protein C-terminal domain-containing protein n=1 Tax=Chaetoceros tenuissimus TaxID=426638 RepID=A0AAD3D076_9STRA|nr:hypothetical protein CTEN210_10731 [Chaetoceros tenuissimus]